MRDLVQQLRDDGKNGWCGHCEYAAETIESLRAQIASARKALEPFAECVQDDGTVTENMCPADYWAAFDAWKNIPK